MTGERLIVEHAAVHLFSDGVGLVSLGAGLLGRGWAQALVLPRGLAEKDRRFVLWSNPVEVIAE